METFRKCAKPDCFRKVSQASACCCTACARAAEERYEIGPWEPSAPHWVLVHSEGCEQRRAERGEFSPVALLKAEAEGRWL